MKNENVTIQEYMQKQQKSGFLVLCFLFIILISNTSKAQTLEAGLFGGASYYLGDLNPDKHFVESNPAYGGLIKYNLNQRFSLGLAVTQANIKSDATTYNSYHTANPEVNLSTQINEFALLGEINFFPYAIGDPNNYWTPYIFGGGAAFMVAESSSINVSAPFGLGVKVGLFQTIGLNLFWSARKTFTDEIDKVTSIDYQGYNSDWYFIYGLNITFAIRLKKDQGCRNLNNGRYY